MTRYADEIVRRLQEGDVEHGAPCWVGHGPDLEPCKRPSTFRVYGISLCPEHGEEAGLGAFEEMHQDAHDFLERFDGPHVVALPKKWVRRVEVGCRETIPADELAHEERTEAALLAAFPFRADRADPETAADIADRFFGNGHPVDRWRDERQDINHLMRVAFAGGCRGPWSRSSRSGSTSPSSAPTPSPSRAGTTRRSSSLPLARRGSGTPWTSKPSPTRAHTTGPGILRGARPLRFPRRLRLCCFLGLDRAKGKGQAHGPVGWKRRQER